MEFDLQRGLRDLSAAPDVPPAAVPLTAVAARVRRGRALRTAMVAAGAAAVLAIGAVAYASSWQPTPPAETPTPTAPPEPVTISWSYEVTTRAPSEVWIAIADEFEAAHPHVTVELRALDPLTAEAGPEPDDLPDLFPQADPPELAALAAAGHLRDLTDDLAEEIAAIGAVVGPSTVDGRVYGLPSTFSVEGFWYNTELFEQAGIDKEPATLEELYAAVESLKAAEIWPIGLHGHDSWRVTHYWYNLVLRTCTAEVLRAAQDTHTFSDSCFVEAAESLWEFVDSEPFNEGYLATPAQQGGPLPEPGQLLATGQVAMELLQGDAPDLMAAVVQETTDDPDAGPPDFLGWFPFPSLPGTDGDSTAVMGTGEGFSVAADAPDEAVDLLRYIVSEDAQRRLGASGIGVPVLPAAADSVTDPYLAMTVEALHDATYVQTSLERAYGPEIAVAMDEAILQFLFRVYLEGTRLPPRAIADAMTAAATAAR